MAGMCSYRDVTESRVDLADLALMNDLITVKRVNEQRAAEAQQKDQERSSQPMRVPPGFPQPRGR